MAWEVIDGKKVDKKLKSRNPEIKFDVLKIYFGREYPIDLEEARGVITMTAPKMGQIIDYGYEEFYTSLSTFVNNTTSFRSFLWDFGVDWNEISDFELFKIMYQNVDTEVSQMLLGGLDIKEFEPYEKDVGEGAELILYHKELDIEITENVYFHMSQYLRNVFQSFPEEKITTSETLKKWYIRKDKKDKEIAEKKKEDFSLGSSFQAIISSCVNHPGFKYKLCELDEVGVAEFFDSVKRLQIYESTTALLRGVYSGFVDTSGITEEAFNFMRE